MVKETMEIEYSAGRVLEFMVLTYMYGYLCGR